MNAPYFYKVGVGVKTVAKGMLLTLSYLFRKPSTLQYPHKKKVIADRYRGSIRLTRNEEGNLKCIACLNCEKICPAFAIKIATITPEGSKKKQTSEFYVDLGLCVYCGLCVDSCPVDAIEHSTVYEVAEKKKEDLVLRLDALGDNNGK